MATLYTDKKGNSKMLYSPYDKRKMYGADLASGRDAKGGKLSDTQKAWRSGYIKSWQDSNDAFRHKRGLPKVKRKKK